MQVLGLIGSNGILPASKYLELVKEQTGIVALYFESWFEVQEQFLSLLAKKLVEFAKFNGCEKIELGFRGNVGKELKAQIKKLIKLGYLCEI